jgi:hypothetical protein
MDRKTVLARAKEVFIADRENTATLYREGFVKIAVHVAAPVSDTRPTELPTKSDGPPVVTFSVEEHGALFGLRLMAEYLGVKEFAA